MTLLLVSKTKQRMARRTGLRGVPSLVWLRGIQEAQSPLRHSMPSCPVTLMVKVDLDPHPRDIVGIEA
jgi:hypothetical protein